MARIKDKKKIPIKDVPNVEDYLVGSDSEDGGKTANFKIGAIRGGDSMTDAAVKVAYENNPDTNEFSDAEKSKLSGLSNTSIYDSDGTVGTGVTRTVAVDGTLKFQNASFYGINFSQPQFSILHPDLVFLGSDNSLSLKNGFPATLDGSYGIKFRIGSGGVPASPTVGQVLAAKDTDGDLEWVNAPTGGLVASDIDTLAELNAIVTDATLIDTADARLSDARTPTAHTHVEADITDLGTYSTDIHANIIALDAVTGTNTGDQNLSGLFALNPLTKVVPEYWQGTQEEFNLDFDSGALVELTDFIVITDEVIPPPSGVASTGVAVVLDSGLGTYYNMGAADTSLTYTTSSLAVGGFAKCLINTATEPTVTGATKITGADWVAAPMYLVIYSDDATTVKYYFLAI